MVPSGHSASVVAGCNFPPVQCHQGSSLAIDAGNRQIRAGCAHGGPMVARWC